jgi:predicted ATP-grasp superfamily ATP-dependent carboligase
MQTNVLVTDGWVRSSYAALRNLSDHGLRVTVADVRAIGMCQASNRKVNFSRYRSHYADELGFVWDIVEICRQQSIGLVFPSHNETEVLAKNREQLGIGLGDLLPDARHCALFNNKAESYEFAMACGAPVPVRVPYSTIDELVEKLNAHGMSKWVIKLRTGNSAKGVFYAQSPAEAGRTVLRLIRDFDLPANRFPQVEEYVSGEGWGCSVLYWQGRKVASFTHRRLREKISTGGTSTLREIAVNAALEEASLKIFDAIGWHGLAMSEWKVCPDTGKFWFIEVNPRLWGSIALPISAGVEFPYLAWLCAREGYEAARAFHEKAIVQKQWRSRWLLGDLTVAARQVSSGHLGDAFQTAFGANANAVDDFFWDDPLVFPGEIAVYLENVIRGRSLNPVQKGMIG